MPSTLWNYMWDYAGEIFEAVGENKFHRRKLTYIYYSANRARVRRAPRPDDSCRNRPAH